MADITGTYGLGSQPNILFSISYDVYRSGQTAYYRFCVSVAPVSGLSSFGYDLKCNIVLDGRSIASGVQIKGSLPNQWTSPIVQYFPSSSGWYSIGGVEMQGTLAASISFSSNSGNNANTGSQTVNIPVSAMPTAPAISLNTALALHTSTVIVTASGGSWGDGGPGDYYYWCRLPGGEWQHIYHGSSSTMEFIPANYGAAFGSVVEVCAAMVNSYGQQSPDSAIKSMTCASLPSTPGSVNISPSPMRRNDTLTIRWGAPSAGSGTIEKYGLEYRYNNGNAWGNWVSLGETSTASFQTKPQDYISITIRPRGKLEYQIRAQNSFGLWGPYATVQVLVKGGLASIRQGGTWRNDSQVFIKSGGSWQEAEAVYVKVNGVWKEQG